MREGDGVEEEMGRIQVEEGEGTVKVERRRDGEVTVERRKDGDEEVTVGRRREREAIVGRRIYMGMGR